MKKLLLGIVVLVCVAVGIFFFYKPTPPVAEVLSAPAPSASTSVMLRSGRPEPAGLKEYYNPTYHMSLLYPDTLTVSEFDEGYGARTITFENLADSQGFQIYITPFYGTSISEAQFKKDIPSGVRKNLKNITLDGATGATFYSEDNFLGETAEIWFLRDNLLYEINSFKGLNTWLSTIVLTWKFMP